MHPIILISFDKDPAIGKAVQDLEAAGFDVRVLNSETAKLVDFLSALAGIDDADASVLADDKSAEENKSVEDDTSAEDDPLHPSKMEAIINGASVIVEMVEGNSVKLFPTEVSISDKISYNLNESVFSSWSENLDIDNPTVSLMFEFKDEIHYATISISKETCNPPVLQIGKDWLVSV